MEEKNKDIQIILNENIDLKKNLNEARQDRFDLREKVALLDKQITKIYIKNTKYKDENKLLETNTYNLSKKTELFEMISKEQLGQIKIFKTNIIQLEKKITDLQTKLSTIIIEKEVSEKRNIELSKQINELLKIQKDIEKQLDRAKKDSTITDMKIEPNIYLKGMFDSFDKKHNALKVFIEGSEYFYPLEDYQCKYLPISGSRVLIFHGDDYKYQIYGLDISKIIEKASSIEAVFKSVMPNKNQIKFDTKEYGYINVTVSDEFLSNLKITLSEHVMLKQIYIDGDYYFCMQEDKNTNYNINEILKQIKGQE